MLPFIFGIIILAIVIYLALRVLKNIILAAVLIGFVMVASYLILGSFPDFQSIPIIGQYIPKLPSTTGEAIAYIRNIFYHLDILAVNRDVNNNLLITVANTGKFDLSDFKVYVDDRPVEIINQPKDPLHSKESTIIQVAWNKSYYQIVVKSKQASATYTVE